MANVDMAPKPIIEWANMACNLLLQHKCLVTLKHYNISILNHIQEPLNILLHWNLFIFHEKNGCINDQFEFEGSSLAVHTHVGSIALNLGL